VFREQYQVSRELASFFEEDSPHCSGYRREFARTWFSNILGILMRAFAQTDVS